MKLGNDTCNCLVRAVHPGGLQSMAGFSPAPPWPLYFTPELSHKQANVC